MNNTLYLAKRSAEKLHAELSDYILARYRSSPLFSGPLDDIRYCPPTAGNRKSFLKHSAAIEALKLGDATLDSHLACLLNAYDFLVNEAALEKKRLELKRAAVKAKADQRKELNLQEGVKLDGADVGQYQVILTSLEEVRLHVYAARLGSLHGRVVAFAKLLAAAGWDIDAVEAWKTKRVFGAGDRFQTQFPENFSRFFKSDDRGTFSNGKRLFVQRGDAEIAGWIKTEATKFALAYVQGYAIKLAQKVGEQLVTNEELTRLENAGVRSAKVFSNDLWRNSTCDIVLTSGNRLTFHTQMILNQSCLGNLFNQWPTRLIA